MRILCKRLSVFCFTSFACFCSLVAQNYGSYTSQEIQQAKTQAAASAQVSTEDSVMSSTSRIDWTKHTLVSDITMDVAKAGIPLPSGKALCLNRIKMELPVLVKDPLLSIYVDDSSTLGDLVLNDEITLEDLTRIIDTSKQTPAYFERGTDNLKTTSTLQLQKIGALLVKHRKPYVQAVPIERISSRAYTGIIIDARGTLPVQGEFITSKAYPSLFPRIWDENMTLVYERNMVDPKVAVERGIVDFVSEYNSATMARVGKDPLWITAKKIYGANRCDPVISYEDYLRITTVAQNLNLLQEGKVVILIGQEEIARAIEVPEKGVRHYLESNRLINYFNEKEVPEVELKETEQGLSITIQNLRFIADSSELLPEERPRVLQIADSLRAILATGRYVVEVDGHTADVNKPNGQMTLSIQRAEAVVNALVEDGLDSSLFTFKGFGGTKPVASNETADGRAQNRRVEIKVIPKATTNTQRL